jgi:O-antigen/teichoic acid export membrane protein
VLANATAIATDGHLGLAGVGAVALAANVTAFTTRIDSLVGGTIYPAICAIQDRLDLLHESFVKSNRLALMWAMPAGIALALFAPDLVHFGIGRKWDGAIVLLQITGAVAAVSQIGFNWDDYFRARAQTAPLAVAAVASTVVLLAVGIPLLQTHGLTGLAIGIAAGAATDLALRAWYLSRLFADWSFARHALRAALPTVPAAALVLAVRGLETGSRSRAEAIAELVAYAAVAAVASWWIEGGLVREAIGYVRGGAR